jgi:SpoVK/Ycf46/Vps4 family AAA+-type ATPase
MGKRVIEKNAANMTSKYIGETEKLIDAAFEEAYENDALLLLNEGDSFIQNRDNAKHSWEISQTNQMLQNLENSQVPVVFTTNLPKTLDKASRRRFTFDFYFDFPTETQQLEMFEYFFGMRYEGSWSYKATPGDFAVISKKARILNINSIEEIIKEFDIYFERDKSNIIGFK